MFPDPRLYFGHPPVTEQAQKVWVMLWEPEAVVALRSCH